LPLQEPLGSSHPPFLGVELNITREFVDDCGADSEVINCPVDVSISSKWCESTESGKLGAPCVVLLRM